MIHHMRRLIGIISILVFCVFFYPMNMNAQDELTEQTKISELPSGFREFRLGMDFDTLETALINDPLFKYRGSADVSLLKRPNESIVEVTGISYVQRAFFQFYEGKLFIMIFQLNTSLMDHYSIFTEISSKYGSPGAISPKECVWDNGKIRMIIERPLSVKYLDLEIFNQIIEANIESESEEEIRRLEFLDDF